MATFNIVLDKRTKLKDDKYNLAVRMVNGKEVMYINITKMTENQYNQVFIRKVKNQENNEFREKCNGYLSRCESIYSELKPFNKMRFRELFLEKDKEKPNSLQLSELFDFYIENKEGIKPKTKDAYRYAKNRFENFKPGLSVGDITVSFLNKFEKDRINEGISRATLDSLMRHLRSIINHFTHEVKLIPKQYQYPFGPGGYSVSSYFPSKQVLKESEIKAVAELSKFESKDHEYARNIWLLLYHCNGSNFADILRMQWSQLNGDYIFFTRKKTEYTRKNNKKPITVPLSDKLRDIITKVGDKKSPYILGLLPEGYTDKFFENKNHKIKQEINRNLSDISKELNLSVPLQLGKARDCYATTLYRNGQSMNHISQMMGHSNVMVTEHYLTSINPEITFDINKSLY